MSMLTHSTMALDLGKEADDLSRICPWLVDKIIRSAITLKPFPEIPDFIESVSVDFLAPRDVNVTIRTENIILSFNSFESYSMYMLSKETLYQIEINTTTRPGDYAWAIIKNLRTSETEELKNSCDCYNTEELVARTLAGERVVCIGASRILGHFELLSLKLVGHYYLGLYTTYESLFFSATIRKTFHKLFRKNHKVKIC